MKDIKRTYRCLNCDYEGEISSYNYKRDEYVCPICDYECIEYTPMTLKEEKELIKFIKNKSLIPVYNRKQENGYYKYLWDDYNFIPKSKELYYYTAVTCEDDEVWIISGRHIVNRIGYFVSTTEIHIPESGIRFM